MAHPEELAPLIPETLPEDFGEWDGEAAPTPLPDHSSPEVETAHHMSEAPGPRESSSYRDAVRPSALRTQRVSGSNPPEPIFGRQQNERANWQRETASEPSRSNSVEYAVTENPKPLGQSAERATVVSPRAAASATAVVEPQKPTGGSVDAGRTAKGITAQTVVAEERDSHEVRKSKMREADEAIAELFSMKNVEVKQEQKRSKNKWKMAAAVGACSILLSFALTILLGHHGAKAATATNQPIQSFSGATEIPLKANAEKPPAGEPLVQGNQPATAATQQSTNDQAAQQEDAPSAAPAVTASQTQMMNDQLTAPRMIQKDAAKQVAEDAPPPVSFGAADSDHGALPGVFNGHAQKVVAAAPPKPPVISSGVAIGMLVHQTQPTYPPIAKSARVSGIVQLHAMIDKNGVIKDLYVMQGPQMLRQAALDAVRTWRYKPYTLNHEPIDVETTINVAFTLGN